MEFFLDFFNSLIGQFTNPKKRVFILYLFLSVFIAFCWLFFSQKKSLKNSIKFIFNPKVFFSKSAKSDYKVFIINQLIMILISPHLLTQITIATALYFFLFDIQFLDLGQFSHAPLYLIVGLFTFCHFIVDDFSKYIVHRWMHKWPFLWALHKVHHSATSLTPMTVFRTHPLEGIVFTLRSAVSQGFVISIFIYLFGSSVDLFTVLGANLFVFLFNVFGSNLRHSHIGIRYWKWLEYILISPAQHHLHHSVSKRHYNKNYGAALAIWDWLFGSLHHSENTETLTLGLGTAEDHKKHTLRELYAVPIFESFHFLKKRLILLLKQLKKFKSKSEIYFKKSLQ
tara:strand:- start:384 stop:1403 length:1020 start_codon:yes stop_codon:yes gene_type:complete